MAEIDRKLQVPLTDDEVAAKADELARLMDERNRNERERKDMNKSRFEITKALEKDITVLGYVVLNKAENRDVSCAEVPNVERSTVELVRKDTGEIVEVRQMTANERKRPWDFFGGLPSEDRPKSDGEGEEA